MAHIVLIDDDYDLVAINQAKLEASGHTVSSAYSGKEGWELLQNVTPDLVVLDCMMEEFTTGFQLANDIHKKFPNLPVIMLTGIREYMGDNWEFGPNDKKWLPIHKFMEKPSSPGVLLAEIETLLKEVKAG